MGITMHRARQCEMAQKMSAKVDTTVNTGQTVVQLQFSFVRGVYSHGKSKQVGVPQNPPA